MIAGWEFAVAYRAAHQVGGDFYDFIALPGDRLGLLIGDVADKGMPAALYMASARTLIRATALGGSDPATVLSHANELIVQDNRADTFLTAFYAMLHAPSGRLTYTNAGHNRPLWLRGRSALQELPANGTVLGAFDKLALEECVVEIQPGDVLVMYTDGLTEANNAHQEFFGEERVRQVLLEQRAADAQGIARALMEALHTFTGVAAQFDDITLIVLRRLPES